MQPIINILLDPVVNFGKVTVSTGYTSTDTEIHLITGDGSKLPNPDPSGSFNFVWFNNSTYSDPADDPYVEIVRCIARVDDTLTLMRHQEGTLASAKNIPTKIYKMILSPTKKTIDDIGVESQSKVNTHSALSTGVHGVGTSSVESVLGSQAKVNTHEATYNHSKLSYLPQRRPFPTPLSNTLTDEAFLDDEDTNTYAYGYASYYANDKTQSALYDLGAVYNINIFGYISTVMYAVSGSPYAIFDISASFDNIKWYTLIYYTLGINATQKFGGVSAFCRYISVKTFTHSSTLYTDTWARSQIHEIDLMY